MIELSPDAVCVITRGQIVYVNAAFLRMTGATDRDKVIGKPLLDLVHQDDRSTVEQRLRQMTESENVSPITERLVRLDGAIVHVEVAGIPLAYEGQTSVQMTLRDVSERVRQQEALRLSEERYRSLFENSSDVIYRFGTDGVVRDVSPAITRLTGWTADEIKGAPFGEFVHPDDVDDAKEAFRSALLAGPTRQVVRIRTRDGRYVRLDTINTPEVINGSVAAVFGTARDVTATHEAMEELKASQRLLATVLNRLPIGVAVADDQGRIGQSNTAGDAIWGFHRTLTALKAPEAYRAWWPRTHQPVKPEEWASSRSMKTGETILNEIVEIEAADGTRKTIMNSALPLIDDAGRIHGVVLLNQDVTDLRSHEKHREEMAARLREVISSTSDGICTIDMEGRTILASPAAARMLGVSDDALLGADLDALAHGGPSLPSLNMFAEVMRTGQARPLYQDVFHRRDGPDFDVEVSCAPILIDGEARGAVVTFRDVTRRNVLERELERAQRLSAIGQLAATVAHEFNNVLMGISPFMEVIDKRAGNDEHLRSVSQHIQESLHRGKQITREILKFAQAPEPEPRPVRLNALLESSLPELRAIAGPKVRVQLTTDPGKLAALVDPTQVHQALSNLVSNARDAMKGEGTIEIEAALPEQEELPQLSPGDWIRISVRDHGAGIPPEIRERIFEPLYTTKQAGGTGLGLAVVQQVVTKHGGFVEVDSIIGYGTAFRLYFRRCDPPEEPAASEAQKTRRTARTIVLVEDDENVAAGIAAVLEFEGIDTHVVNRGAEAEDAVERFQPDAVLLDRGLPDMDGLEVSRILLARWPALPIIFSTGHGGREDIEELAQNARVAYLLKPYSTTTLLDALDQVLPEDSPQK
jgi:two-component system cell cycle sensor histidine kinase/response regulator CckA